jgi:DNA-binding response OmpR family regulator
MEASSLRAQALRRASAFSAVSPTSAPHLLVIDDSATIRTIVEICHRRAGFTVTSFVDGVEALTWLSRSRAALPPLIYLDIEMPRMDGYEVARQFHARPDFAQTTLILLSGRDGVMDRLKGRLAGAKAFLTKPFRAEQMLALSRLYLSPLQETAFPAHKEGDRADGSLPTSQGWETSERIIADGRGAGT